MKISASKQQLAKIISENGGWREGAESAAQCIRGEISFWHDTATKRCGDDWWGSYLGEDGDIKFTGVRLPNWHQTILSRDEYFHLYPAPDADGWIEWKGGECPVAGLSVVDVKYFDVEGFVTGIALDFVWGQKTNIVYYRKTRSESEQVVQEPKPVPVPEAKPTIEQLAADYHNRKDYAYRKQEEADAAKSDADAKLAELVAAGRALGLVLSVADPEPELVITDWRDLLPGDEVSVQHLKNVYSKSEVMAVGDSEVSIRNHAGVRKTVNLDKVDWKFIRRPAKGGDNA